MAINLLNRPLHFIFALKKKALIRFSDESTLFGITKHVPKKPLLEVKISENSEVIY